MFQLHLFSKRECVLLLSHSWVEELALYSFVGPAGAWDYCGGGNCGGDDGGGGGEGVPTLLAGQMVNNLW